MYLGVNIACLIKIFFDISLSIADIEEITPEWVAPFCQQASEEGGWHASIEAEIEAKKAAPVSAQFEWQKPQPEAPAEEEAE